MMTRRGQEILERVRQLFIDVEELRRFAPADAHAIATAMVAHIKSSDAQALRAHTPEIETP